MTDFIKFCPVCRTLFRDPDVYHRHFATCGAAQMQDAEPVQEPRKTADRRRQTAEKTTDGGRQTAEKTADGGRQFAADASGEEIPSESAAVCGLPSAVSAPPVKPPKFKT